jgi:hypothetical protein
MWKDKKFYIIIGVIVLAIAVGGVLGGLAITRNNDDGRHNINIVVPANIADNFKLGSNQPGQGNLNNVVDNILDNLVKAGRITQEQANQFKDWWEAKPDIPGLSASSGNESATFFGMMHKEYPNFEFRFRGHWSK